VNASADVNWCLSLSFQINYFIQEEGRALRAFGYDPVSQNFPKVCV
jgi:hypothetical protein